VEVDVRRQRRVREIAAAELRCLEIARAGQVGGLEIGIEEPRVLQVPASAALNGVN
jgi:hypothetical protein